MKQRTILIGATLAAALAFTACEDIRVQEFPDGKVRMETTYVKDKKQGLEKEYYNNGTLRRETTYNADRKEGLQKEYYEDGTLQAETPFADGYIEGEVVKYHKNGKLASKAKYQKNKQVEFGEVFDPDGTPATDGSYKDPRDGYAYQWIRIGTQLWTAENMNFGTYEGSVCNQCNHWGRLYNFENAKKACLEGFHMPTKDEWKTLLTFAETSGKVGTVLKAGFGWDPIKEGGNDYGNGKDELGFGVKAGGAHFAKSDVPLKERKFEDAGKKAYLWTAEGEVLVFYHDKDIAKFEKFDPEFGASLRCLKD
jgi:uncharacterized protein (TIGR02145 family)